MRSPSISSVRFLNFTTPSPEPPPPATACGPLCPVTAERPHTHDQVRFRHGCRVNGGHDVTHPPTVGIPLSPSRAGTPHQPTTRQNPPGFPQGASPHGSPSCWLRSQIQRPEAHRRNTNCMRSRGRHAREHGRSRDEAPPDVFRWGFVEWLRPEAPPACPPAGSRCHRAVAGAVTSLSPTTPTPPDCEALTCSYAPTLD